MPRQILLVDDDPNAAQVLAASLERRGFIVQSAASVGEGLNKFQKTPADLLITDVILPDGVGYDLISEIRKMPVGIKLPVILTSGIRKSPGEREHALRTYNALDFLVKPFPIDSLLAILQQVFQIEKSDVAVKHTPLDERLRGKKIDGEIQETTFSRIFCHFHRSSATGVLTMTRDGQERKLFFVSGLPVFASSSITTENLGRHLLSIGKLGHEDYQRAIERQTNSKRRFGEIIVEMGFISQDDLYKALRFHIREKILSAFGWKNGHYEFEFRDDFLKTIDFFDYNVYDLFLTGVHRYYPGELLARELAKLYTIPVGLSELGEREKAQLPLSPKERKIFDLFDGKNSLSQILEKSKDAGPTALPFLYAFLLLGILEVKVQRPKTAPQEETIVEKAAKESATTLTVEETDLATAGHDKAAAAATVSEEVVTKLAEHAQVTDPASQEQISAGEAWVGGTEEPAADPALTQFTSRVTSEHGRLEGANYYEILGVRPGASGLEVETAAAALSRKYELPATQSSIPPQVIQMAGEIRKKIAEAAGCLSDSASAADYAARQGKEREARLYRAEMAFIKGKGFLERQLYSGAEEAFRLASDQNPDDNDAYAYLAYTLYRAHLGADGGSFRRQAMDMLRGTLMNDSSNAAAYFLFGKIASLEERYAEARQHLSQAIRLNPAMTEARTLLTEVEQELTSGEKAGH